MADVGFDFYFIVFLCFCFELFVAEEPQERFHVFHVVWPFVGSVPVVGKHVGRFDVVDLAAGEERRSGTEVYGMASLYGPPAAFSVGVFLDEYPYFVVSHPAGDQVCLFFHCLNAFVCF